MFGEVSEIKEGDECRTTGRVMDIPAGYDMLGRVVNPLGHKASSEHMVSDVSGPWQVVSVCDALSEALGRRVDVQTDFEELLSLGTAYGSGA